MNAFHIAVIIVISLNMSLTLYAIWVALEARTAIHPSLQATVNKAYSKAQQALENSAEAIQIAKDEVPEKRNKPCNSSFVNALGNETKCTIPKYPGHELHGLA